MLASQHCQLSVAVGDVYSSSSSSLRIFAYYNDNFVYRISQVNYLVFLRNEYILRNYSEDFTQTFYQFFHVPLIIVG